uniref:Disintegrin and metalloproteinase domain-containing protein 10-like n=1 Tax=Saccoglossus kowalevskii TaxID=10224 RepID=A0ABM0MTT2_SACKO|nr:PREDICTED: disintegrin and metalloproteinase domain-containing protein 10-like [Saccoglossus kowalevskii]
MARLVLLVVSIISATVVTETRRLSNSISHYEPLDYNQRDLHEKHDRARRSADGELELQFNALERDFHLRLRRATSIFAEDFTIETSEDGVSDFDTSHIYTGFLQGEPSSHCHGSIHNGTFEGSIRSGSDEYFIEPAHRYYKEHHPDFHSVIYMGKDVQLTSEHRDPSGCSMSAELFTKMQKIQNDFQDKKKYIKDRTRRNSDQTTCPLFIQTDHTFYEKYGSYKEVVSAIASALDAVNYIYGNTVFGSYTNIGFLVKRIRVYTTSDIALPQYNFANEYIGVEKYLDLASSDNFDEYCLSYAFCARDFTNGILGLAWIGYASDLQGGGICDQYREYINQGWRSLNTGVVTTVNYGFPVPPLLFHLTFAHELGHSFGSPHDYPSECRPGGVAGNYIMYSKSSDGLHVNNNEFSECSIGNMTLVLDAKKNRCFTSPDFAICGNGIVEGTEECDCGYEYECEDKCCEPRKAAVSDSNACKLSKYIPGVECSLSDGPCCDPDTCRPMAIGEVCRLAGGLS